MAAPERQKDRTRRAICAAFESLIFTRRYEDIRLSDVAHAANVGRSTLYTHFRDRDDILVAAMSPLLNALVETLDGQTRRETVTQVLDHFWSHRDRARMVLYAGPGARLEQALAQACVARLQDGGTPPDVPTALISAQVSAMLLSAVRLWLRGETSLTAAALAAHLCACASALAASARSRT